MDTHSSRRRRLGGKKILITQRSKTLRTTQQLISSSNRTETNAPIFETIAVARAKVTGNTAVGYEARTATSAPRATVVHSESTR